MLIYFCVPIGGPILRIGLVNHDSIIYLVGMKNSEDKSASLRRARCKTEIDNLDGLEPV